VNNQTITVKPTESEGNRDRDKKSFTYDFAFDWNSTQDGVYDKLGRPIVEKAMSGYNATIFAYGQTGSGKTHTMMGFLKPGEMGIIPALNAHLFGEIVKLTTPESKFLVTASYLEIYNEVIHDLLNPVKDRNLKIREHPELGIYVEGLCELVVKSQEDVLTLIEQGAAVRKVAATEMNQGSSRSHSCFTLRVAHKTTLQIEGGAVRETSLNAKINLIDLAGSERAKKTGATGTTLKEGANINRSLMALGNVITALSEGGRGHIPYRDSMLTRLLQESLGGNAQTLMVAAVSPADYNYDETVSTLRYAQRAKSIENSVVRNEDINERVVRELKEEIERLRAQLTQGRRTSLGFDGAVGSGPGGSSELAARLDELRAAQQQTWEEKEKLSRQLEQERSNNVSAAIGEAVDGVKKRKLETMKEIKRLQKRKEELAKRQRSLKGQYDKVKESLQIEMATYQKKQAEHDALPAGDDRRAAAEAAMAAGLDTIEKAREELLRCRKDADGCRGELKQLEEKLTEERAELVASNGLLDQNERLRAAVAAEEREKFNAERGQLVEAALEEERRKMEQRREELEKSIDEVRSEGMRKEVALRVRVLQLEKEVAEAHAAADASRAEVEGLENRLAEAEVEVEQAKAEASELRVHLKEAHADTNWLREE
ncbi:unnamed protein product, partial [Phaeothamnion confervicola]